MASGTGLEHPQENFIAIWNYKTREQVARLNCHGNILDMMLIDHQDLAIFSSKGFYRVDEVVENCYKVFHTNEKITCRNVCFL